VSLFSANSIVYLSYIAIILMSGFSAFYPSAKNTTEDQAIQVFHHAIEKGVTLFNSATFYGPLNEEGFGANLRLIRKCIEGIDRSKIQLMVKIAMDTRCPVEKTGTSWVLRGDAASIRADVDYALETLGTDYIDIIVLCRVPFDIPIEESVRAMSELVSEGKARHIGLSEASSSVIRRAHSIHPIFCIEQEWSLWARDIETDIVPTCRELGVKIVAYSPLGRGFLTGTIRSRSDLETADPYDFRVIGQPKFAEGNFEANLSLVDSVKQIADKKGITVGQLALAWVHAQGNDVIPIPGTSSISHLDENLAAADIILTESELNEISALFPIENVVGDRYAHMQMTFHGNK
jgi:aryl-alcohol dehydrogenase-like predicted oxidoreductase